MKTLLTLLVLTTTAATANAQSFEARCRTLASEARIQVVFEDRPVTRDDSRSLDELRRLSQSGASTYHRVLGLTHAEPSSSMELRVRHLQDTDGKVCAAPDLNLRIGLATLTVYLARELQGACRRAIVEAHEQEHVAVWRNHLRIGARLLTTQLQQALGQAVVFEDAAQASAQLGRLAESQVQRQLKVLVDGIRSAHQQIDAPGSYQIEEGRLRACP